MHRVIVDEIRIKFGFLETHCVHSLPRDADDENKFEFSKQANCGAKVIERPSKFTQILSRVINTVLEMTLNEMFVLIVTIA